MPQSQKWRRRCEGNTFSAKTFDGGFCCCCLLAFLFSLKNQGGKRTEISLPHQKQTCFSMQGCGEGLGPTPHQENSTFKRSLFLVLSGFSHVRYSSLGSSFLEIPWCHPVPDCFCPYVKNRRLGADTFHMLSTEKK